jgi:phenylacetate-CoA oxygenase PaaH subunit
LNHKHVGSLRAPDAQLAIENARDVYTRRSEGISIWVVQSALITASDPADSEAYFEPSDSKRREARESLGIENSEIVLSGIHKKGIGQSVLSAYLHDNLVNILDHYNLTKYFDNIIGLDNIYAGSKTHLGLSLVEQLNLF